MVTVAELLEVRQGTQIRKYSLDKRSVLIGRRSDNGVVLSDAYVSRHHAKLKWHQGALCVVDLASSNGTSVNGNKLESHIPYPLKSSDVISIGDYELTLRVENATSNDRTIQMFQRVIRSIWVRVVAIVLIIAGLAALGWWLIPMALPAGNALTSAKWGPMVTYTNTTYGYSIDHPQDWSVDWSDETKGLIMMRSPQNSMGSIAVLSGKNTLTTAVDNCIKVINDQSTSVKILYNEPVTGVWDWHLTWNSLTSPVIYNEAYFKMTKDYTYMVWTSAPGAFYEYIPFNKVYDSFKID